MLDKRDMATLDRPLRFAGVRMPLPKSKRAQSIDLSDDTITILRQHKSEQSELKMKNRPSYADHDLMFARGLEDRRNRIHKASWDFRYHQQYVSIRLHALCKAAKVKPLTPHGLRHTCATLLLTAGTPVNVVQERSATVNRR